MTFKPLIFSGFFIAQKKTGFPAFNSELIRQLQCF